MKILHVNSAFPPAYSYGGALRVAYEVSKELVSRGHEVTFYTTDELDADNRVVTEKNPTWMDGIEVYHFRNVSNSLAHSTFPVAPSMAVALNRNIREFDLVHLHEYRTAQAIMTYTFARKSRVPYVINSYGALPRVLAKKALKATFDGVIGHRILKKATMFIAQAKEEEAEATRIGVEPHRIRLIYNGMDVARFRVLPTPGEFRRKHSIEEEILMLYLGRIHKSKGIDFAIEAFARLSQEIQDMVLVVAGPDHGYQSKCQELATQLGVKDRVKFVGFVDDKDKLSAYRDADLFVHTVDYMGGVGLAPLEAILCGSPVVVTKGCGEVIEDANCGYIVQYRNVDQLAETMREAVTNPSKGRDMVVRGREYIANNLEWGKVVRKVEDVYENCLRNI